MPLFMDVHTIEDGVSADDVAGERRAHFVPLAGLDPLSREKELPLLRDHGHAGIQPRPRPKGSPGWL